MLRRVVLPSVLGILCALAVADRIAAQSLIFAGDFESGGFAGWSAVVPPVMTWDWNPADGTLAMFRKGQLVAVYERDTAPGRSIANAITQLYAVDGPGVNLLSDSSPLVPPQILVGVGDDLIPDPCSNDPGADSCDYFVHHAPEVTILPSNGGSVELEVVATATQHFDQATPIAYGSDMTISVPYHALHTIVDYQVETILAQSVNARHAVRPFPFYELVAQPYTTVDYLDANCTDVQAVAIPMSGPNQVFLQQSPVCADRPWAALYPNASGNLGMILESWVWSTGSPELLSYTEPVAHPGRPNLYFQSDDHSRRYDTGSWTGRLVFLAYTNAEDSTPVADYRDWLGAP